jgi:hypothetical protein
MEQSPSEEQIVAQLIKKFMAFIGKVNNRARKSPSLVTILSKFNPVHIFQKYFFNIILPWTPSYPKWFKISFIKEFLTWCSELAKLLRKVR